MLRWMLVLVLTVVSTTAWAQPASTAATARAQEVVRVAEQRVNQLALQRNDQAYRHEEQLKANTLLKNQPKSWRRNRQLEDGLAEAKTMGDQLASITNQLDSAQRQLATARSALVVAIDAELTATSAGPRADQLRKLRVQVVPKHSARRIVLPDTKIDQRSDPEELDEQAAAIRDAEAALDRQVRGLDQQVKELQRIADMRKAHDRAIELERRDDNTSRRNVPTGTGGRGGAEDAAPTLTGGGSPPPAGGDGRDGAHFEIDAPIVLVDVVDNSVIDALNTAQRSGDPQKRADATKKARDAVAARKEQLRKKRVEAEELARKGRSRR